MQENTNQKSGSLIDQWLNQTKEQESANELTKAPKGGSLPTSFGQQRLFFLQNQDPNNPDYNYSEIFKISGSLDVELLVKSVRLICSKHQVFQENFQTGEGIINTVINPSGNYFDYDFQILECASEKLLTTKVSEIALIEGRKPFDLIKGQLIRGKILKTGPKEYYFILSLHHIIADKWSMKILKSELGYYYKSLIKGSTPTMNPLKIQYSDFSYWQRNKEVPQNTLDFWQEQLSGELPMLELPVKKSFSQSKISGGGHSISEILPPQLSKDLLELSKESNTTMFTLLFTAFNVLLYKYSGQKDIIVGTPFSNRDHADLEKLIGFFNETLVIRTNLKSDSTFESLLDQVHTNILSCFDHKNMPFEQLINALSVERNSDKNPLFRSMFLYDHAPMPLSLGSELIISEKVLDLEISKFDLTLSILEDNGLLTASLEYSRSLFEASTIERMLGHFTNLLRSVVSNPDSSIGLLNILEAEETATLLKDWNQTDTEFGLEESVVKFIQQSILSNPTEIACSAGGEAITYGELNEQASKLACQILQQTKGIQNPNIGLFADRSVHMIIGILGILKAGGAYVPIDPDYPKQHTTFILKDAEISLVILPHHLEKQLPQTAASLLFVDSLNQYKSGIPLAELPKIDPSSNAYLIYTSGSSGTPKGVPVTHKNLFYSTQARFQFYSQKPKAFLLLSSFSFDSSVAGIFWTLSAGGKLVIPQERAEQDMHQLAKLIHEHQISHTLLLPSLYKILLQNTEKHQLSSLNTVIVAGEACHTNLSAQHFQTLPETKLCNEYGPTEATVWCIAHIFSQDDNNQTPPIGKPIANTSAYILNADLQPCPIGVTGHLYIGGKGVTHGYWKKTELTKSLFIDNPFSQGKLYNTGDLATYRPDGSIEFLGRADYQVKIRGYRVELEEITTKLLYVKGISEAVTKVFKSPQSIVSYVVCDQPDTSQILTHLSMQLPKYMVPKHVVKVSEFPKLPNGKINLKKLQFPKTEKNRKKDLKTLPKSEMEVLLVNIWEEVLGISAITIHDNFFELGGDSIISIQLLSKARECGIIISPTDIFQFQTIAELALHTKANNQQVNPNHELVRGEMPKTPIQKWFFNSILSNPGHWHQLIASDIDNQFTEDDLNKITYTLIHHHDALRSVFPEHSQPYFSEPQNKGVFFSYDSVSEEGHFSILTQAMEKTDLTKGNLFQLHLFKMGNSPNKLYLLAHHLTVDIVSWNIILADIQLLCKQLTEQKKLQLPSKTSSFKEWALSSTADLKRAEMELSFWLNQINQPDDSNYIETSNKSIYEAEMESLLLKLDKDSTNLLTTSVNEVYNTNTEELLITALVKALERWKNITSFQLALEHHGRFTKNNTSLDFSKTVGWFTSFYPVHIKNDTTSSNREIIISLKETLRAVPNYGVGFGKLKYLHPDKNIREQLLFKPALSFNYGGNESSMSEKYLTNTSFQFAGTRSSLNEVSVPLELNTWIKGGKLSILINYSNCYFNEGELIRFGELYIQEIKTLIKHCSSSTGTFTPSDFPEIDLNQNELDELLGNLEL